MRTLSTLCLLLFFSVCFSQIEDLIRKAEYGNATVKVIPYVCGFGRTFSPHPPVNFSSLQGNMERPKDSVLLKGLQIKVPGVYAGPTNNKDTVKKPETKIVLRCRNSFFYETPLIIVDGVPQDSACLINLNPNDIERFDIIKKFSLVFSSHSNQKDFILITTKQSKLRKFIIKDFLDGNRIPGATVSFISADKKDSVMMAANDSGVVVIDKLKSSVSYQVYVSATGYKLLTQSFKNGYSKNEQELMLERDVKKMCDVVIIGSGGHIIRCSRNYQCINVSKCSMHTVTDTTYSFSSAPAKSQLVAGSVFPNPAQKGKSITIETTTQSDGPIEIRLISLDGKLLLSQPQKVFKGMNRFTINTDTRWTAGIYFLQLYANGKLLASDKVIIQ